MTPRIRQNVLSEAAKPDVLESSCIRLPWSVAKNFVSLPAFDRNLKVSQEMADAVSMSTDERSALDKAVEEYFSDVKQRESDAHSIVTQDGQAWHVLPPTWNIASDWQERLYGFVRDKFGERASVVSELIQRDGRCKLSENEVRFRLFKEGEEIRCERVETTEGRVLSRDLLSGPSVPLDRFPFLKKGMEK